MSRANAVAIFRAALAAGDPARAIRAHVSFEPKSNQLVVEGKRYALARFDRIRVIGAGKAGAAMAQAVEDLLGSRVTDGWINVPAEVRDRGASRIHFHRAGHPIPDPNSVSGAKRIAAIASESGPRDLIVCLISGGASALMALPAAGVTLAQKRTITKKLLSRGATIHELNAVRKHLSGIKGGRLAALAYPATVVALILSDVIGDDLDVIGSGPTVPDRSTCADAMRVLEAYGISTEISAHFSETPKPGAPEFRRVQNLVVGSNRQSITAAAETARKLGYETIVLSTTIDGETRDVARMHAAIARERAGEALGGTRICFLSGGETKVTLRGNGLGGRNQEFVLAALEALMNDMLPRGNANQKRAPMTIFSAGTDGIDGPTDAAGAVADLKLLKRAAAEGLDPRRSLANNDSYHFFEKTGGLIKTGHTGTNVMDVRMMLIG